MTGRRLYVCDSFQGLPEPTSVEGSWLTSQGAAKAFELGQYAVDMGTVQRNVARFGEAAACEWVPGFFCDSLPSLDAAPALVFAAADVVASTRDTLKYL
jgi:O-methyltransferase